MGEYAVVLDHLAPEVSISLDQTEEAINSLFLTGLLSHSIDRFVQGFAVSVQGIRVQRKAFRFILGIYLGFLLL